jgi:hypothetical protein
MEKSVNGSGLEKKIRSSVLDLLRGDNKQVVGYMDLERGLGWRHTFESHD